MKGLFRSMVVMVAVAFPASAAPIASPESAAHFDSVVAPILAGRCVDCHSGAEPKGELDLSRKAQALDLIEPGEPDQSRLWEMIASEEMPPKHPLPERERRILHDWIAKGATWGTDPIDPFRHSSDARAGYDWWSLQPLKPVEPPKLPSDAWSHNEVDRFVFAALKAAGWGPAPAADPRTLVRRLYFTLHGLPAPIAVVEQFSNDPSPMAWARLVDALLASPHYGERWARHWMDVARFGESGGYEYNKPREHAWPYRDWLIRSFNADLRYDQFVRMQLAGDLLEPNSVEGAAAVGFLVAGVHNEVLGKNPKMKMAGRQDELEEIAGTVGQAFLGMTVHCARCHDHKFDPISEREYYQFVAALDGVHHGTRNLRESRGPSTTLRELARRVGEERRELVDRVLARGGDVATSANILELRDPLEANRIGQSYQVSLKLAPTVWTGPSQATAEHDGMVVRLIGTGGRVLTSQFVEATPWSGGENAGRFESHTFRYEGDGSGPVRIRLEPYPLNSGRFGGAIDDLRVSSGRQTLFEERFNDLVQTQPHGMQAHSQRRVFHSARSERWSQHGLNAIHAEERAEGDLALQLFGGNGSSPVVATTVAEREIEARIVRLERKLDQARASASQEVFTVVARDPKPMRIHRRGDVNLLGETVAAGGFAAIQGPSPSFGLAPEARDAERRRKLANWVASPDNPLFHRVAVNRVWHHHFGQGLVLSPNDFGFNGGQPSHPELLDWLASWFRVNGYSLKKLHRLILTSATWQQASRTPQARARRIDADNRLLWRQNPRRVDAETFRDSVLAASGALNRTMYGPGFKDVRVDQVPPAYYYVAIDPVGPEFNRRTIYRWHVRGQRSALLDTFDCPDPSVTAPTRSVTTTPSQALSQWNHPFVLRMAEQLARRVTKEAGDPIGAQVTLAWRLVLARNPSHEERAEARVLVERHGLAALARALFNSNEFIWID